MAATGCPDSASPPPTARELIEQVHLLEDVVRELPVAIAEVKKARKLFDEAIQRMEDHKKQSEYPMTANQLNQWVRHLEIEVEPLKQNLEQAIQNKDDILAKEVELDKLRKRVMQILEQQQQEAC